MSSIFDPIKNSLNRYKAKSFIKKWVNKTDVPGFQCYISRDFQEAELYYDLYWYIKPSSKAPHVDSISRRCSKEVAVKVVKRVEKYDLPEVLTKIKEEKKLI